MLCRLAPFEVHTTSTKWMESSPKELCAAVVLAIDGKTEKDTGTKERGILLVIIAFASATLLPSNSWRATHKATRLQLFPNCWGSCASSSKSQHSVSSRRAHDAQSD